MTKKHHKKKIKEGNQGNHQICLMREDGNPILNENGQPEVLSLDAKTYQALVSQARREFDEIGDLSDEYLLQLAVNQVLERALQQESRVDADTTI